MSLDQQFHELCNTLANRYEVLTRDSGMLMDQREIEPELLSILAFVNSQQSDRPLFASLFGQMVREIDYAFTVNGKKKTHLIIEYCMRELQWPEVFEAVCHRFATEPDPSIKLMLKSITTVYSPKQWYGDTIFEHFSTKRVSLE